MDSPDVRGLPKMWEEGRLKVEPASENTCVAMGGGGGGGRERKERGGREAKGEITSQKRKRKIRFHYPFPS